MKLTERVWSWNCFNPRAAGVILFLFVLLLSHAHITNGTPRTSLDVSSTHVYKWEP